jgi:glycosyltransferase involved in cell wall biosynthesis
MLEAMAAGIPVVASDVAGVRDLIVNHESGFLVPVGDRAEFARRVTTMIEDRAMAERVAAAAQQWVRASHGIDTWVKHYEDLYTALD